MTGTSVTLDHALEMTRTGDVWLFRGRSGADRAIRALTNAPVNHVGMAVVIDDLPPLMWHAELGRSLPDAWTGNHQRGVQLHDMRQAVLTWAGRYDQRPWLRQLLSPVTEEQEGAVLRTIARLDGTPFPSTATMAGRWLTGRALRRNRVKHRAVETAYCAEVLALTYQAMGLLPDDRKASWYDPGRFWSGDDLPLLGGAELGGEIAVDVSLEELAAYPPVA
ncbi:hypothetical protein [Rhodococcus sp. X156]|uniref:hypothetical protein n=1 Tax=Rhodococcus sp. X156 TaxID=2499145 RepID=UPI000FDB36F6|nr:hypothetical protein [Rhodococcus sp. X156]